MSRSFKARKWCDRNPFGKRKANARVRKYDAELADGMSYKKVYESWGICDFKFWDTENPKAGRK